MKPRAGGLLAIFPSSQELEEAAGLLRKNGLSRFDALSPYNVEALSELVPKEATLFTNELGALTLAGGIAGLLTGFGLQWYALSWSLPISSGARPLFSWPNYLPVAFELAILFAAVTLFFGLWLRLHLPEPYHPIFHSPSFDLGEERFYLFVPDSDPAFPRARVEACLRKFPSARLEEVPE